MLLPCPALPCPACLDIGLLLVTGIQTTECPENPCWFALHESVDEHVWLPATGSE